MRSRPFFQAALALAVAGAALSCTVKQNETPELTGPSGFTTPVTAAPPTAQFDFTPQAPAVGSAIAFDGSKSCPEAGFNGGCVISDRTIVTFNWDFGDGTQGTGPTVSHAFKTLGSFNVSLTVVSDRGLSSTASKSVSVGTGGAPPTAAFVFSPTGPTIGQSVSFNASPSRPGQNHTIVSYSWDFGDGGKGSGVNPTHAFTNAGTYNVLLIVTDEAGQTATGSQSVPIQTNPSTPLPTADFVFSPTTGVTGQSVLFNGSTSKAATSHQIVSYSWNFGDGGTGTGATPTHTFGAAATYTVVLTVTDDLGQTGTAAKTVPVTSNSGTPPPTADFVFSPTGPLVAQPVSFNAALSKPATGRTITTYAWNWGDGSPAGSGVNPSHTFANAATFSVVLTVTDDLAQSATVSKTVTVSSTPNDPPTASFVFSPGSPQVNAPVLFDATQSTASQGHTLSYAWNFGDNGTGTGVSPSHAFTSIGAFSVVLKVTDNTNLQTATTSKVVTVTPTSNSSPPTVSFVFSPAAPLVGQQITFTATATPAPGRSIATYAWNFGDGTSPGTVNPVPHTFLAAATFTVAVTVTDDIGQTATASNTVTIGPSAPTATFTFSPSSPITGQVVTFNASATPAPGRSIASYTWNFNDGTSPGSGQNPTHTFATAATFNVALTVKDDLGQSFVVTNPVTVKASAPPPTATFIFSPTTPTNNQPVFFDGTLSVPAAGQALTTYSWNYGDGTSESGNSTFATRTHTFTGLGTFNVTLTVTQTDGQFKISDPKTVTVGNGNPTASFTASPTGPLTFSFDGSGSTAVGPSSIVSYAWAFGDNTFAPPSATKTASHTYAAPGTYTVTLTVKDSFNRTAVATQSVIVP